MRECSIARKLSQLFLHVGKPRCPDRHHVLQQVLRRTSIHKRRCILPVALNYSGKEQPRQQSDHEKIFLIVGVAFLQPFYDLINFCHRGRKKPLCFWLGNLL